MRIAEPLLGFDDFCSIALPCLISFILSFVFVNLEHLSFRNKKYKLHNLVGLEFVSDEPRKVAGKKKAFEQERCDYLHGNF